MPYDFDALIETATKPKEEEPEVWRNRFEAIREFRSFELGTTFKKGDTWLSHQSQASAEEAVVAFHDYVRISSGDMTYAQHGEHFLYLGPVKVSE
jgi:hypothetical protein